jgi:formate-dependent nitrite reductase membrane component NrfD
VATVGVLFFFAGIAGIGFFWAKLNEDFASNMHIARDTALLFSGVCLVWIGMGIFGHGLGLL